MLSSITDVENVNYNTILKHKIVCQVIDMKNNSIKLLCLFTHDLLDLAA